MPVAIPILAVVLIALLCALLCWAGEHFAYAVAAIIPKHIPVIGSFLYNAVLKSALVASALISAILAPFVDYLKQTFMGPVTAILNFVKRVNDFGYQTLAAIAHLADVAIPAGLARVAALAHSLVHAVRAYALRLYHRAEHAAAAALAAAATHLWAGIRVVRRDAARALALTATHLWAGIHALRHDLGVEVADARALARALVAAERAARVAGVDEAVKLAKHATADARHYTDTVVRAGVKAAEGIAAKDAAAAVRTVESVVVAGVAAEWPGVRDEVKTLEGVLATDLPGIRALVDAIPRAVPTDLAAAIPAVISVALPALRFMEDCGIPNCRNLSQYGRDLQALLGLAEGAGFLALLVWIAQHPDAAAHDAVSVVAPLVDDTASAARSLLGV